MSDATPYGTSARTAFICAEAGRLGQTSPPFTQQVPAGILPGGRHPATGNEGYEHNGSQTDRVFATGGEVMEPTTGRPDAEFLEFLERCHNALRQHAGGNPGPYLELWSRAADV